MHRLQLIGVVFACALAAAQAQDTPSSNQSPKFDPKSLRPPVAISTPEAVVPLPARLAGTNGTCLVSLIVDVHGKPDNPHIVRCTDSIFAENSVAAVMKYQFKPAMTRDGIAVAVELSVEVNFIVDSGKQRPLPDELPLKVGYQLSSPPGINSTEPDANGVYPLTNSFAPPNAAPKIVQFNSKGWFGQTALRFPEGVTCDVLITINAKGKPSDAQVTHCDESVLEKPAMESLLKSKYEAALLNGKAVPVRVSIHLVYGVPR